MQLFLVHNGPNQAGAGVKNFIGAGTKKFRCLEQEPWPNIPAPKIQNLCRFRQDCSTECMIKNPAFINHCKYFKN